MGWVQTRASLIKNTDNSAVRSYLIRLPADSEIPRTVQRITGISDTTLESAVSPETAWQQLMEAAGRTSIDRPGAVCPAVIHFARFERPFLQELNRQYGPPGPFPFQIICTHEIAIRLLPDLPRKGMRAIAGFYGHSMPELKRCADHAVATAIIWQNLVRLLNTNCDITRLDQLIEWLAAGRPQGRSKRAYPMDPVIRQQLPDKPGIYRMLHGGGGLLYIGKAKSLKKRVNSYFRPKAPHAEHILEMLTQARDLNITPTGSALEAAILESDEIKYHSPPYNIALRRRQRRLAFCTKDLTRHAPIAGNQHTVGPLPAGRTIEALTAFGLWFKDGLQLAADPANCIGYAVLAISRAYAPEIDCLEEGFEIFKDRYGSRLATQTPLRFLTALGAKLWQERLEAAADAGTDAAEQNAIDDLVEQPEDSGDASAWTPESVADAIESMIRRSAHQIRRARWFCLLSDSWLVWTSAGQSEHRQSLLAFKNGVVVTPAKSPGNLKPEPTPGFANSLQARQNNIDLETYDRLRVVTTEIRRILSEDRNIELHLGPKVALGRPELLKALRWV
jgi:DNA polymerase-3 subunit epsilon